MEHESVLLKEAIEGLEIQSNGIYVDGTFGRGGHARAILDRLSDQGLLLAMDKDPEAAKKAEQEFKNDSRFRFYHGSFTHLTSWLRELGLLGKVNGLLLDLGVSSPQLEEASRGFSFLKEGPLDMRMNPEVGESAAKWLSHVEETELARVLKEYGEERYAKRIAGAIVREREEVSITTTKHLAEIVSKANPSWEKHKHPATRSFQAIRIYINQELNELRDFLSQCLDVLTKEGRLLVISFHSLEDRIVKRFMQKEKKGDDFPSDLPVRQVELNPRLKCIGRAIKPSEDEVKHNMRARSAVLRIAEKL